MGRDRRGLIVEFAVKKFFECFAYNFGFIGFVAVLPQKRFKLVFQLVIKANGNRRAHASVLCGAYDMVVKYYHKYTSVNTVHTLMSDADDT